MTIFIIILWYLTGVIGGLFISRKIYPETNIGGLLFLLTIGGMGGLITVVTGLIYLPRSKWMNKKLF